MPVSDSEIQLENEESVTDTYDKRILGKYINASEIWRNVLQLISNSDIIVDEESMRAVIKIHEKLKQEKENAW